MKETGGRRGRSLRSRRVTYRVTMWRQPTRSNAKSKTCYLLLTRLIFALAPAAGRNVENAFLDLLCFFIFCAAKVLAPELKLSIFVLMHC